MALREEIRNRMNEIGIGNKELSEKSGVPLRTINNILSGVTSNPTVDNVMAIAHALGCTIDDFVGNKKGSVRYRNLSSFNMAREDVEPYRVTLDPVRIPVLGKVVAGIPLEAVQDVIDYEEIPARMVHGNEEYFGLQIKGDSMAPRILDGDVVIVRKQSDIESGDIAIVLVNGDDATVKRVKKYPSGMTLEGFNPSFEAIFYTSDEIEDLPVEIIGKVVELRGKL